MPTQSEVARYLDLGSTRQVRELRDRGVIPDPATSTLDELRVAYIRHLREAAAGRVDAGSAVGAERARYEAARAELAELELAEKKAELVPFVEAEVAVTSLLSTVRSQLLAIPAATAQEHAAETKPARHEEIARRALYEALEALAGADPEDLAAGKIDRRKRRRVAAAAAADREPVGGKRKVAKP